MRTLLIVCLSLTALLLSTSCSRTSKPIEPIELTDIPAEAKEVFQDADPEVAKVLTAALAALEQEEYFKSWNVFQNLAEMPDLTKKQQRLTARAVSAVGGKMQEAEAAGDQNAAKAMKVHRALK